MEWIKLFVQRRILASILGVVAGVFGIQVAEGDVAQVVNAAITFLPAALNLWSYVQKIDSAVIDRSLAAGLIPVAALVLKQLGVEVPDGVLQGAYASGAALLAALLSLWSRFSTNRIQPTGALASPNP